MNTVIKFGTDGWRALIAEDFTFENVRICAQSLSEHLTAKGQASKGVVIGYDTRFASEDFAAAASEVMAANGIKVYLCQKATPTPVISYGVVYKKAAGAIIITASHNPHQWNGFKIKTEYGSSAPTEVIQDIESRLPGIIAAKGVKRQAFSDLLSRGLIEYINLDQPYIKHLNQLVDLENLRKSGMKVAVDSMFGAGAGYFNSLLAGNKTKVIEINKERNPLFPGIQPEPISPHLSKLCKVVKESEAAVGLATDGDADRIGIVDDMGNPLTSLQIFALLSFYLLEVRGERGAIVRTLNTTTMLNRLGEIYRVPVHVTSVGFKYVAPKMMAENALVGGEESSGFGFRGHLPERDGILAGLYFLDLMYRLNKTPTQLLDHLYSIVGPHHYKREDVHFPPSERDNIISRLGNSKPASLDGISISKRDTSDGYHYLLSDGSWLLIRFSGTEPLLRIYAESSSINKAESLIKEGRNILGI